MQCFVMFRKLGAPLKVTLDVVSKFMLSGPMSLPGPMLTSFHKSTQHVKECLFRNISAPIQEN